MSFISLQKYPTSCGCSKCLFQVCEGLAAFFPLPLLFLFEVNKHKDAMKAESVLGSLIVLQKVSLGEFWLDNFPSS
jgi:hypothetical protein